MHADELLLRRKVGIPDDARRVLVIAETSHWDPNWLLTSEQYFAWRVERSLDRALAELEHEPRRIFSIECLFFLQRYWERRPRERARVRRLIEEGRLRLSGTGITTPDTNLPHPEAILRDYLLGQEWLRKQGMTVEPRVAYLPDSFGHSPALPSLMRALGIDGVAVTRIDGMHFIGSDLRPASSFPLAGSSAEQLSALGSQSFVWRAPDGAEVIGHWNAFTYFQGDMLAHLGVIRWMGVALGIPWRTRAHVRRRIDGFVRDLGPLSRTPYLCCPIGCDFNDPIKRLVTLIDRYNELDYPETGVWVVNAGIDDYLALVGFHRDRLPMLELDPNPYWMGAHASRPTIKRRCNGIVSQLLLAEKLAAGRSLTDTPNDAVTEPLRRELAHGWQLVALSNHHDFITGTSPDRVWHGEQRGWLERAESHAEAALGLAEMGRWGDGEVGRSPHLPIPPSPPMQWHFAHGDLEVVGPHYRLIVSERAGGCITSLKRRESGEELLSGPSNDLVVYEDSGGLWRMGHEYLGGRFSWRGRASAERAQLEAREQGGVLQVRVRSRLGDRSLERRLNLRADSPILRMQLVGAAARQRTVTCRFRPSLRARSLHMDVPGGVIERPWRKLHDPTFWAARSFARVSDRGRGMVAMLSGPACVALRSDGAMEWVALRNAPSERAFGVLPLPAHPAVGNDGDESAFDYAVSFVAGDDAVRCPSHSVDDVLSHAWLRPHARELLHGADALLALDRSDARVTAIKQADRGEGIVARLSSTAPRGSLALLRCGVRPIAAAHLCDARERDLAPLSVEQGTAQVRLEGAVTSVRLLF